MFAVIPHKCHTACIYIILFLSNAIQFHFIILKVDAYKYVRKQGEIVKQGYF